MHLQSTAAVLTLLACTAGCASSDPEGAAASDDLTEGANTDVQVLSASAGSSVDWALDRAPYDLRKCVLSDRKAIESGTYDFEAKADCTDALMDGAHLPSVNRYTEPLAWIQEAPTLTYATLRHWCSKLDVVVAVKAAAWDAPSFRGIGFYGYDLVLDAADADRRTFYAKDDPRLVRTGEATLKNGEAAYLYEFTGAGPCAVNGAGDNPTHAFELKPYVTYDGDVERWEDVPGNHGVRYHESWSREHELLQ